MARFAVSTTADGSLRQTSAALHQVLDDVPNRPDILEACPSSSILSVSTFAPQLHIVAVEDGQKCRSGA
jgi:hypothetical protein